MSCTEGNVVAKRYASLLIAILLVSGGCASAPPKKEAQRMFFPHAPETPRIEWIATYQDQHNFPKTERQKKLESLLGKDPSKGFARPLDVASDGDRGLLYVADPSSRNIYIYDLVNYKIDVLDEAGGMFVLPVGLAVDNDGKVYVTDRFKKLIMVYGPDKRPLFSFGGLQDELEAPVGIAVDGKRGKVYVADVKKNTVNAYDMKGKFLYAMGSGKDGRGQESGDMYFNFPVDVDVLPDGNLVVADTLNARIHIIDHEGLPVRIFGKRGDAMDKFDLIKGVAVDREGHIYIADTGTSSIKVYDSEGTFLLMFGGPYLSVGGVAPAGFSMLAGITADSKNGIFVADQLYKVVQKFQYLDEEYLKANPLPKPEDSKEEEKAEGQEGNKNRLNIK